MNIFKSCFIILGLLALPQAINAQIVLTDSTVTSGSYSIDTTHDLINGATPTGTTAAYDGFTTETSGGIPVLTDGVYGVQSGFHTTFSSNGSSAMAGPTAGLSATYSLGGNPLGYDITDIQVYSGWNDSGRYQQAYTISYSLVSDTSTFIDLYTLNPYPSSTSGADGAETELTNPTAGVLASRVADVKITFNSVINGYTGYREFVVDGAVTSVPEPSTYVMLAFGLGVLVFCARRRARLSQ